MVDAIWYVYHVYFLWPVQDWIKKAQPIPPYQSACSGDCRQGRDCDCVQEINEHWPFPTAPKP